MTLRQIWCDVRHGHDWQQDGRDRHQYGGTILRIFRCRRCRIVRNQFYEPDGKTKISCPDWTVTKD